MGHYKYCERINQKQTQIRKTSESRRIFYEKRDEQHKKNFNFP